MPEATENIILFNISNTFCDFPMRTSSAKKSTVAHCIMDYRTSFGGELGIRTLGSFWEHDISRVVKQSKPPCISAYLLIGYLRKALQTKVFLVSCDCGVFSFYNLVFHVRAPFGHHCKVITNMTSLISIKREQKSSEKNIRYDF